jgi:hypothetical protein
MIAPVTKARIALYQGLSIYGKIRATARQGPGRWSKGQYQADIRDARGIVLAIGTYPTKAEALASAWARVAQIEHIRREALT